MQRLTSETVTNVVASVETEAGYVATGDEVSLTNVLDNFFKSTEESSEMFDETKWNQALHHKWQH